MREALALLHALHLVLELLQDEARAPARALRQVHVREEMVAHIHHPGTGGVEAFLDELSVTARVQAAYLQAVRLAHHAVRGRDLVHRPLAALDEKVGFARGDDDDREEVAPVSALWQVRREASLHHRVRVQPVRVGDQDELLARRALVEQSARVCRVHVDELERILHDVGLHRALHVRLEESFSHSRVQRLVRRAERGVKGLFGLGEQHARVEAVDELGVQAALGDREESVEEDPAWVAQVNVMLVAVLF